MPTVKSSVKPYETKSRIKMFLYVNMSENEKDKQKEINKDLSNTNLFDWKYFDTEALSGEGIEWP